MRPGFKFKIPFTCMMRAHTIVKPACKQGTSILAPNLMVPERSTCLALNEELSLSRCKGKTFQTQEQSRPQGKVRQIWLPLLRMVRMQPRRSALACIPEPSSSVVLISEPDMVPTVK